MTKAAATRLRHERRTTATLHLGKNTRIAQSRLSRLHSDPRIYTRTARNNPLTPGAINQALPRGGSRIREAQVYLAMRRVAQEYQARGQADRRYSSDC